MTREERLELLKQIEKDIHVCSLESTLLDDAKSCAIHSVIEELEKEPCEDAISRQAVLDGLANIAKAKAKSDAQKSLMGRVMFFAEHLPPVTPKQTDALDKIRAEIDQKQYDFMADKDYDDGIRFGLMLAYQIIDKYNA
jgi:hypothetical protein